MKNLKFHFKNEGLLPWSVVNLGGPTLIVHTKEKRVQIDLPSDTKREDVEVTFENDWNVRENRILGYEKSSKGDKTYTIVKVKNTITCDCPGYKFRKKCKHVKKY